MESGFTQVYCHEITVYDFRDFEEKVLQNFHKPSEDKRPQSVQKAKMPLSSVLRRQRKYFLKRT